MGTPPAVPTPVEFLLVEDDPSGVRQIHDIMRAGKVRNRIWLVPDGAAALRLLREEENADGGGARPDVVLMDIHLSGQVDGRALLDAMESDPGLRGIPVVVLVGSAAERDEMRARGVRPSCILLRPVDFHELSEIVHARDDLALAMVRGDGPVW